MKTKVISQAELTTECWPIQFWGLEACARCEYRGTDECGGKRIRKLIESGQFPRGGLADKAQAPENT